MLFLPAFCAFVCLLTFSRAVPATEDDRDKYEPLLLSNLKDTLKDKHICVCPNYIRMREIRDGNDGTQFIIELRNKNCFKGLLTKEPNRRIENLITTPCDSTLETRTLAP
ncbi:hypothetical protein FGIG_11636 [Fasciola gigantica]|uniref:Uncharacterized protein n=1 Tax=Fasciola gigantica TaxID=46835 RepID=A0A504YKH7_FASGI|nr:hypothetical protein FGIG_11636 [Fasciola gigantica]